MRGGNAVGAVGASGGAHAWRLARVCAIALGAAALALVVQRVMRALNG
ncbi:MAG TPA: hypothetical protein VN707_03405 [Casimicrobiaceae bacterium]|nr:hypothetical protein [Casimicrobiaceae bacterium]